MAEDSLNDLHFFLNRRSWQIELLIAKNAWLHIYYAVKDSLSGLYFRQAHREFDLDPMVEVKEESKHSSSAIPAHAPVRHKTRIRNPRSVPTGGVVLSRST